MPNEQESDEAVMLRVKAGEHAALEILVERYKQPVLNLVFRTLHDATEAEDIAQNVFFQVYKSAPRYEVTAKFSTWLFTIARNLCLNEIRRRSRHPADPLDPAPAGGGEEDAPTPRQYEDARTVAPPEALIQSELEIKVQEAVATLPEAQRTAILLCQQGDMSYEQISEVLGCTLSATKSLLHRARETLKQKLKPYLRADH